MAQVPIRDRIVELRRVRASELASNPRNWRRHPPAQAKALRSVLEQVGYADALLARQTPDGLELIDGHLRQEITPEQEVPVLVLDVTEDEAALVLATLDPLAAMAEADAGALKALLDTVSITSAELAEHLAGYTGNGHTEGLTDPDEVPEPPAEPITQPGDLWLLGEHRLLCGDATNPAHIDLVMAGRTAQLSLTDPPYGVGRPASGKADYRTFEDSPEQVEAMAPVWVPLVRAVCDLLVFSPGITRQWWYPAPDWVLCWFYGGGQLRSPWGFNCWQPFLCYGADPSLASGHGARPDAVDLNTPANAADIDHPCPKPVQLWAWLFHRLIFQAGALVLDPFLGSGTTVIVAEQMGHVCYGIEIDPTYCDVAIARWEAFTGKKASRG